ncbi:circularly permuted type 2 ATP-grasp protein [Euzebya rosea]|uniref:circularly permuted type 2 ATP-grasp protein n=1 Tax=Euzebya rosea TaxID=2052804 RepID=UPI000D3E06DE|nr:circularly permuted type 2 ATP-grasp protein [Euzebya rosea]
MTSVLDGAAEPVIPTDAANEMTAPDGSIRPGWEGLHRAVEAMDLRQQRRLRREVARLLEDDGVTYHVPGTGKRLAWQLDPLPLIISGEEWAGIEAGIVQRAELLNLVLADLYGPRTLLTRGLLPARLVHDHPGFLRALHGVHLHGPQQLFTYAADLARMPDGAMVVLGERTQAPSGAAYALQNRIVTSRVMGQLHRTSHVQRLAPYFRALRRGLQQVAPGDVTLPRTVLLSPGSRNETAFEHALLAARLGLSLVEGSDLQVRDGRVWLRSLGHPEPVDVIVRRIDEEWCDPLELRPDSLIGVPGLVNAVRNGTVAVVNTLGSGVLENPALQAFLPGLAQHLLGQSLRLPSVHTVWLGEEEGRREVMAAPREWLFKPTARTAGHDNTIVGAGLDDREVLALRARVAAAPHRWVAQEPASPARSPSIGTDGIVDRRTVLRTFAVADGSSYTVMPGGLTRVAPDDGIIIANHQGAWSKDTWVLGDAHQPVTGFWSDGGADDPVVPDATMPSRAAENLYWLGRYAERAEGVARLLREIEARRTEFHEATSGPGVACITALLQAVTQVTTTYPGFVGPGADRRLASPQAELTSLASDERRPGTLAHAIRNLLDSVDVVRDQLSGDTWLVVVDLQRRLARTDPANRMPTAEPGELRLDDMARVLHGLLSIQGLAAENMIRDAGWRFMDAGRRIERGLQILALLRATTTHVREEAADGLVAESVLRVAESIITYRRRYRSTARVSTLLDLLLVDPDNPRSLTYQFDRLAEDLTMLPGHPGAGRVSATERPVLEASTALRVADTDHLASDQSDQVRGELDDFLSHLYGLMSRAGEEVRRAHFTHLAPQRTMRADTSGGVRS